MLNRIYTYHEWTEGKNAGRHAHTHTFLTPDIINLKAI